MNKALDIELNNAINHIVWRLFPDGFDVSAHAPSTLEALCNHLCSGARMCVWNGASDYTIFGDARTNYAFRAWHDWHHYVGGFEFNREGETRTCRTQCQQLVDMFGDSERVRQWCKIVEAEIIGQLEYNERNNGHFPIDQKAFVEDYLRCPDIAITLTY